MKAGVIGHPIAHSKSPIIHNHWMGEHNVQGSYETIDIAPENLAEGVQKLIDEGYDGFNVTIPHKQNIMKLCDRVNDVAQTIGAVNTVRIKDGKLFGSNTDAFGFIQNIKHTHPDFDFKNKTAVVLGAGGASRAVLYGLIDEGVKRIILTNRTIEVAQNLANEMQGNIEVIPWENRSEVLANIDILVNTTALGMNGKPALELDLNALNTGALISDIVYVPLMTNLLTAAQKRGNPIVSGIGMLLHQARPAFAEWTNILPDISLALEVKILK
jgi:shikimate dehydrogenase